MKKQLYFIVLVFLTNVLSAKEFAGATVKGIVLDNEKNALPFTTVILKNSVDSSLYKGEITNDKGEFNIENVKDGNYFLQIQVVGFQTYVKNNIQVSNNIPLIDIGTIVMAVASKELQTVTVAAEKPFIERQVDKTVVNIENSIVQSNSSVMEVMQKLPGVLVSDNDQISLKGKQGVIIMIDGKPTPMTGQDLANMLKGMPSSNIQKIEIITNPSAKYDAAGNAGIINIVMKKNRRDGFNGSVSAGYGQGRYAKYNGSVSLNVKQKWYNLYLNYGYSHRKGFNNLVLDRYFYAADTLQTVFETNNYITFPFDTHTPRLGADFYLSKKTTLSVLGSSVVNEFSPSAGNHTDILNGSLEKVSSYDFTNSSKNNWYNYAFNSELKHQFDSTGKELTLNLDYGKYWNKTNQLFVTTTKDASDNITNIHNLVGKQNGDLYLYSAKLDYTQPILKNIKLDAGLKSSYVDSDKDVSFFNRLNTTDVFDSARSSHFLYSENINAAYINVNKEYKKVSYQLGLRAEHTAAKGKQLLNNQSFNRNYVQVFPTLFVAYKANDNHGVNLSLGRRIDRPGYDQMNPFKQLIDATTYAEGNPYLLPQLTYNSELSYNYKSLFFVTATYSFTKDNITEILVQDSQTKTTIQKPLNVSEFNYFALDLSFSKRLTKWWTTNTNVLSFYGNYAGTINNYTINQGAPSFFVNSNNNFSILDGLSAECGFQYNHRNLYGITTMTTTYNLSAGIQKSVLKKRGNITINVTDILWTSYPSGITVFGNVNENWTAIRDTRVVNVNFSYKFGNAKGLRMRRTTGADDEKNRIGNS